MIGHRSLIAALVLAGTLAGTTEAFAQRAFLYIANIPGDSVVEGYANWIDVLSLRQNATAATRKSIACDIAVVKNIDVAGPALWATAANGTVVPDMIIAVLRNAVSGGAGGDVNTKQYEIKLANVRIISVQATAGATDSSETIGLLPGTVTLTYFTQTSVGTPGPPVAQTFNCQ
jgi:type VI protein secretion system component Hcp